MKIRRLTFSIVGKPALVAVDILKFAVNKSARIMLKTLQSAIANAENNNHLQAANLIVSEAHVDDAQVLKRFMPVARGSAHAIKKRSSHIRIVLSEVSATEGKKKSTKAKKIQQADKEASK